MSKRFRYFFIGLIGGIILHVNYLISYVFGIYELLGYEYELDSFVYPIVLIFFFIFFLNLFGFPYFIFSVSPNTKKYGLRIILVCFYTSILSIISYFEYMRFEFLQTIQNWQDTSNNLNVKFKLVIGDDGFTLFGIICFCECFLLIVLYFSHSFYVAFTRLLSILTRNINLVRAFIWCLSLFFLVSWSQIVLVAVGFELAVFSYLYLCQTPSSPFHL